MAATHGLRSDDSVLMPAPLAHVSGLLNAVLVPGVVPMAAHLMARWDPERALTTIEAAHITYMGGPRYSYHAPRRLTTYGQLLIGGAHGFDSYFPTSGSASTGSGDSIALAPGAGLEVGVNNWLSIRAVEGEYLITHLPNDVNAYQHNLRVSTGIVFRFSTAHLSR